MRGSIHLLVQDLLLLPEVVDGLCSRLHLSAELLLSATQIRHPCKDEIKTLHDLLPALIAVVAV